MRKFLPILALLAACHHQSSHITSDDAGVAGSPSIAGFGEAGQGGVGGNPTIMPPVAGYLAHAGQVPPPPILVGSGGSNAGSPAKETAGFPAGSSAAGVGGAGTGGMGGTIAAGSGGSTAGVGGSYPDAGVAGSVADAATTDPCVGPPGLYDSTDTTCTKIASNVRLYTPQYPLWTDGSIKTRYVYLPPGTTIDGSDPDHWVFPVGTRFYKEFDSADGQTRVEIRYLEKVAIGTGTDAWSYDTYVWSGGKSPTVQINGVTNALNTGLDVPARSLCTDCHNHSTMPHDMSNGFQALQLNHANAGVTLQSLIQDGTLVNYTPTVSATVIPGRNALETSVFGYWHGNCGHCHSAKVDSVTKLPTYGDDSPHSMALQQVIGYPLAKQPAWTTNVCVTSHTPKESYGSQRVVISYNSAGVRDPALSSIYNRDRVRGLEAPSGAVEPSGASAASDPPTASIQMPPLGTNKVDADAVENIRQWILGVSVGSSGNACIPN
jgi:hypothetical protein